MSCLVAILRQMKQRVKGDSLAPPILLFGSARQSLTNGHGSEVHASFALVGEALVGEAIA